jgi:hypothetical protein
MSNFKIDSLKGKLQGGGARPNLFKATVVYPAYAAGNTELTSFMCKSAQLPASVVGQIDVPFRGRTLKVAGDRTFENWTVTIINDENFVIRDAMERWMDGINNHEKGEGFINPSQYMSDLIVDQLSRKDGEKPTKSIVIKDAFPVNVSAIDLSYDSTDAIEEFTVEFAYQRWESNTTT